MTVVQTVELWVKYRVAVMADHLASFLVVTKESLMEDGKVE